MDKLERDVLSDLLLESGAVRVTDSMLKALRKAIEGIESDHALRVAAKSLLDFEVVEVDVDETRCAIMSADGRKVEVWLDGDCCSRSVFEENSVNELKSLVGERIRDIEHAVSGLEKLVAHDDESVYRALKITTDKRVLVVDWRNDSNGYYDGTCQINGLWESSSLWVEGRSARA